MRATAQDRDAAAMMGINVNRTISFTFLIAGALAGAGGLLYALYFGQIRYDTGFQLGLIAFTAAVLGGIGNLPGAVLGALCIGFIQAFNEGCAGTRRAATGRSRSSSRSSSSSSSSARRACSASERRKAPDGAPPHRGNGSRAPGGRRSALSG